MPTVAVLLQFTLASLLLAVTPGPAVVLVLTVGADRGRRAGAATSLGLALGTFTWVVVTTVGLGAVLGARPGLLSAITAIGGGYLLWLGVDRLRVARADAQVAADPSRGSPLRDGLVVNLLNPSIAIFLASVIPPFLDLGGPPAWQQVLTLGTVLVVASTVVNVSWGVLGASIGRRARRWAGSRPTAVAVGAAYIALGLFALAVAVLR